MALKSITAGEILLDYINDIIIENNIINTINSKLNFTGRADELCDLINEIVSVNMVGRIVTAGASITKKYDIEDPLFDSEFTYYLKNTHNINSSKFDELYRISKRAVKATLDKISDGDGNRLKKWAINSHNYCYMCGVKLYFGINGNKTSDEKRCSFTREHIWPREYGGDSVLENLLPCCAHCNSSRKTNFATWAMPSVQSLIKGLVPSEENLLTIDGSHRYAMHYRFAKKFVFKKNMSLKEAFLKIGPWQDIRVVNEDDVADFFNLENHNDKGKAYGIYL